MSYTNETTHFGIPLPLGSDLTTPMDYNEAFEAVDGALFGAQGDASTANENAAAAGRYFPGIGSSITDAGIFQLGIGGAPLRRSMVSRLPRGSKIP